MQRVVALAAWCVSQQQLPPGMLRPHLTSMLTALRHALDNPMGSMAVVVEAMQVQRWAGGSGLGWAGLGSKRDESRPNDALGGGCVGHEAERANNNVVMM